MSTIQSRRPVFNCGGRLERDGHDDESAPQSTFSRLVLNPFPLAVQREWRVMDGLKGMDTQMTSVVEFTGRTKLDSNAQRMLERWVEFELNSVILIGRGSDGQFYFESSVADGGTILWEMEIVRAQLMRIDGVVPPVPDD